MYKYIEPRKTFLVQQKKHYTDTVSIKKIHLFKLFVGGDQYVLAFGPFETKIEAANFFEKKVVLDPAQAAELMQILKFATSF